MNGVGRPERETQNRVIALFCDEIGYRDLGSRAARPSNTNIEERLRDDHLMGAVDWFECGTERVGDCSNLNRLTITLSPPAEHERLSRESYGSQFVSIDRKEDTRGRC